MHRLRSNSPCWCGSGGKFKRCHGDRRQLQRSPVPLGTVGPERPVPEHIERPDYARTGQVATPTTPQIHDDESLGRLRSACRIAAEILQLTGRAVEPGITTDELDAIAHAAYIERNAYPSDLRYNGFRKSICTSVNGVICHGIPDDRPLESGDIINIDVTAFIDGMHGDTSATFAVGPVDEPTAALIDATRTATLAGIAAVRPGASMQRIGRAVEEVAAAHGFTVVREYGGHGIGGTFHAAPHVYHHVERIDDARALPNMSFTVEPMLLSGGTGFTQAPDGWTEHTDDAMPSAQFEHTVIVAEHGAEILTVTADGTSAVDTPN